MQKINLDDLQDQIDSRQWKGSEQPTKRTEQQERIIETIWQTLADVYGSTLVTQYGEVMPEAWIALLKGLTPSQIKDGLNRIANRESSYPPNGAEFRQLCLPETISPDGQNTSAYLEFSDEKHPEFVTYHRKNGLTDMDPVRLAKRRKTGNDHLKNLKDSL